jgi:PAS domain S-box-containing protein
MSAGLRPAQEDHASETSQARILLVDDLEANLLALDGLLRREDVKLLHAHSGREALEFLLAEEIALAIIDVQMPVMNGFELAELMRGAGRTRQIPIMLITAGAQNEQHRFRGYDAGAVDFLYKPIEADILRQKVAVFLALYWSRRKIIQQRDELLRREAALRESEERLRIALVASHTIGFDYDMRTGAVVYTANAPEVLGMAAQVDGTTAWRWLDPEDVGPARMALERAIAEGREYHFDLRFRRPDNGAMLWLDCRGKGERDVSGRPIRAFGVATDITERKQMEEQRFELLAKERALASERALRETEAELARVMRALSLGELATSIAHEVNQPLAGVVTNAEAGLRWLSGDPPNLEEAKESLANIADDGARAGEIIRRLREFLKKRNPETTPLDINDVIQEAVALASAEVVRRQVGIRIDLSDGLPGVRGDRVQLQQVILNLIINGVEAMAATAPSKELVVSSGILGEDRILVAVRDSGAGIRAEDMPRIFDPFYTTKPTGMGMGLSISRSILEAHGGRIWAEANEGPGLTVQFSLPVEKAAKRWSAVGGPS